MEQKTFTRKQLYELAWKKPNYRQLLLLRGLEAYLAEL